MIRLLSGSCLLFLGLLPLAFSEANFCGSQKSDPDKTCISVRLPWQEEPIFFCTEKDKMKYRSQCAPHSVHCTDQLREGSLLVATPWDCCPFVSVPDPCLHRQCPPPPFNRTCTVIPVPEEHSSWECCPRYFCDTGSTKDCSSRQLMPGCTIAPKNKTNCVAFRDEHGCCNQYQCDGDGKPGYCPMQLEAMKFSSQPFNASSGNTNTSAATLSANHSMTMSPPKKHPQAGTKIAVMPHGGNGGYPMPDVMVHSSGYQSLQCVGDFNCPTNMKCCSNDISVYSDGSTITKNYHATHGFCIEPVHQ